MFSKKTSQNLFTIFYDTLLFLMILLFGMLIIELVLPGLTASILRLFDIIILLCLNVFVLFTLSQKISPPKNDKPPHNFITRSVSLLFLLIGIAAFMSASYKYAPIEIILLLIGTLLSGYLIYRIFFRRSLWS